MTRSTDPTTRATRDAANVAAAAVVVFAALWTLSTQVDAIRAISPFADDPWDALATYAALFLPFVAGATWIRSLRNRGPVLPPATAQRIRWGSGLAAGIVLVAALADVEAILAVGFAADAGVAATVLTILTAASAVTAAGAVILSVRAAAEGLEPDGDPTEPDIIDDAIVLVADVGERVGLRRPVERFAIAVERFLDGSPLSPRRHRWLFGVVLAIGAAVAFDLWHAVREGPWINGEVALLFGALVAAGVLAIYLATVVPLRLLRPPRPQPQPRS